MNAKTTPTLLALAALAAAVTPSAADELRGLWVCPWEMNSPAAVDRVVAEATAYNFNAVFFEVRYRGDALYVPNRADKRFPNAEPRSPHLAGQPPDFDPLAALVAKGHAAGLQVHAWVTAFVILNKKTPTPPDHVAAAHPEWLSQNDRGDTWDPYGMAWLEPTLPEVQDYLYNVFLDIVVNYDVDGLHLDYVRYPSPAFGRNAAAIALYRAETGKGLDDAAAFADWRRGKITAFVARLYGGMAEVKPQCRLTTAVFASRTGTAYSDCLQDWTRWLADEAVDAVVPMAYSRDAATVGRQIEDGVGVAGGRHVYAGIMVPEVKDADYDEKVGAEMVAKGLAARGAGAAGVMVFSYAGLERKDALVGRALRDGLFVAPAEPPAMAWKGGGPAIIGPAVVSLRVRDEPRYAVRVRDNLPRRYAYLLAKEVSARAAGVEVFMRGGDDRRYRVYAGAYDDRAAAEDLRSRLAKLGY